MTSIRRANLTFGFVRVSGIALLTLQVATAGDYPAGFETAAWVVLSALVVGAAVLLALDIAVRSAPGARRVALAAVAFDTVVVSALMAVFSFQQSQPLWALYIVPVIEAALRFGLVGGAIVWALTVPVLALLEWWRADRGFGGSTYVANHIVTRIGIGFLVVLVVGGLVRDLTAETNRAEARAREAEGLRDALGRRVDVLEAVNRAARALGSTLELERALDAFTRVVSGVIPFERFVVHLRDGEHLDELVSDAGGGPFRRAATAVTGSVAGPALSGRTIYRRDLRIETQPAERQLVEAALRSRLTAPLVAGATAVGAVSFLRREPDAFSSEEVELATLLGRVAGTAVQNIRAFDAERRTAEELRRLSALRADFVSLVSHELRSPMAAVIGSARTLQARWHELRSDQREAFLALIADETSRLAALVGDVLDTSRIEAGVFSYTFDDVDLRPVVEESVATASVAQDEVRLDAQVPSRLPRVRADRERLRQVLGNLIDNAVKHSPAGEQVDVRAWATDGVVKVAVRDRGPGIPRDQQRLIFEKFGRANSGSAQPGTGLGLFIARSIAEAHGGTLDVESAPGRGATFTLALPAGAQR